MSLKIGFVFCALLLQNVTAQYIRRSYDAFAYDTWGRSFRDSPPKFLCLEDLNGNDAAYLAASNGNGLAVTSLSPFPPIGLTVVSENGYEGPLIVAGQVPFLSAVGVEGPVATSGEGAVTYACGKGTVSILSENIVPLVETLGLQNIPRRCDVLI